MKEAFHITRSFKQFKPQKRLKEEGSISIPLIISIACWNTGLLWFTFLTLTIWNRQLTIQINHKRTSF